MQAAPGFGRSTASRRKVGDDQDKNMLRRTVKFETRTLQRLHASLLEHQAQLRASGELARQLAESRRSFWKSTFPIFVAPQVLVAGLVMGVVAYLGADIERIFTVGCVGVITTLVAFVILYPHEEFARSYAFGVTAFAESGLSEK